MLTHIRLEKPMDDALDSIVEAEYYASKSEFIREAIRDKINLIKRERALRRLGSFKGIVDGKPLSKKEREKAFTEFVKKKGFGKS
jgi:Arc/MetJ-type ribon-helix-helix transcriptional regulator